MALHRPYASSRKKRGPREWWELGVRVAERLAAHNAGLLAGGTAMYALLSVFPGLAAAVFPYGLFATPAGVAQQMQVFAGVLPPGTRNIFNDELRTVAGGAKHG